MLGQQCCVLFFGLQRIHQNDTRAMAWMSKVCVVTRSRTCRVVGGSMCSGIIRKAHGFGVPCLAPEVKVVLDRSTDVFW